jgi:predicted house-cleaning noncanonical NTP pyrophosphatase (MazG superfamily)
MRSGFDSHYPLIYMDKKYYHRKLVRDKIPKIIKASGDKYETRVMGTREFEKELKRKLLEEAKELSNASKSKLPNELADVLEVIKSIASHYKISFKNIEKLEVEKRRKRGGFRKRLFLVWSTGKPGK